MAKAAVTFFFLNQDVFSMISLCAI
jgi:hypothetical protein